MKAYIIAGAPSPDIGYIRERIPEGAFVLCADRGYSYARQAGITPSVIIGDFDSCPCEVPEGGNTVRLNREKDFTDTLHCVEKALERGCDELLLFAATGGRLDHTLANLCALEFALDRGADAVILSEREEIRLLDRGEHRFDGRDGLTFSLFPFGCGEAALSISGAHYPLSRYRMKSGVPIGVSNIFEGDRCVITVESGRALLVVNTDDRFL